MNNDNDRFQQAQASATLTPRPLPAVVERIRERTAEKLGQTLEELFANSDDMFFDLSSRATSNNEQNIFFESMREIRVKKAGVKARFDQLYRELFDRIPARRAPEKPAKAGGDELALVHNDDLEIDVAISTMVSRARVDYQEPLYHVTTRLDHLLAGVTVGEHNSPLDPALLCETFRDAAELFDLPIKSQIILLKQFDRQVLSILDDLCETANEALIAAGVLPTIRSQVKKAPGTPDRGRSRRDKPQPDAETATGRPTPTAEEVHEVAGAVFAELTSLLGALRTANARPEVFIPSYSSRPGPVVEPDELVDMLGQWQTSRSYEEVMHQHTVDIRAAIEQIMAEKDAIDGDDHALKTVDEDIINLVAMFFDFVLSDPDIPLAFQALISRLQIPVLRIALKDKEFFNSPRHPARNLINEIARLAVGFNETGKEEQDRLFQTVNELVKAIHDHDSQDDLEQTFAQALAQLKKYASAEERKAELVERRSSEMASGQAKARAARSTVQAELYQRLKDTNLPVAVAHFLVHEWQNVLFLVYLKDGDESRQWLEALQVVDDMTWSLKGYSDEKSLARRDRIVPELREKIARGLERTLADEAERAPILTTIDDVYRAILEGNLDSLDYQPLRPEHEVALNQGAEGGKSWKEMTALERQQVQYQRITYDFIRKADALKPGAWMVFEEPRTGKTTRCKLAAKLEETDSYVFVNRFGFKVLEKRRKEVAEDLQNGRARLLDNRPLFDRAFGNITTSLRGLGQPATP